MGGRVIVKSRELGLRKEQFLPNLFVYTLTAPRTQCQGGVLNRFEIAGYPCVVYEWQVLEYTLVHLHFKFPLDVDCEIYRPSSSGSPVRLFCGTEDPEILWRQVKVPPAGNRVLTWVTCTYGGDKQLSVRDCDWHLPDKHGFRRTHSMMWTADPLPLYSLQVKVVDSDPVTRL